MKISSYLFVCIAITSVLLFLVIAAAMNVKKNNIKYLLFALVATFFAALGLTMSIGLPDTRAKIFWDNFKFVGVVFLPMASFLLNSSVLKLHKLLSKKIIVSLCVFPVITLVFVFTNDFHHLFTASYDFIENEGSLFVYQTRAFWYYIHTVYSYSFILVAFFMLVILHLKKPKIYRAQTLILIAAAFLGIVVSVMSVFRLFVDYGDASILTYSVGMCLQFWGLVIFKPTKIIQLARDIAFNNLQDPVLIFDNNNSFLDANICAVNRFNLQSSKINDISDFLSSRLHVDPNTADTLDSAEICASDGETMYFDVDDRLLYDTKNEYSGRVLLFNDITKIKAVANELEFTASRDILTGLYNRRSYRDILKKLDKICPVSSIYIIINNMKFYKNIIGISYCEALIKALAEILTSVCGEKDFCARTSDEEFVILAETDYASAASLAGTIAEKVKQLSEKGLYFEISYGISTKNYKNENIEIVCKTATENMYNDQLINALANGERAVSTLKNLLYIKTFETAEHIERTTKLCVSMAQSYGVTSGLDNLTKLASAHDIGIDLGSDTNDRESSHTIRGYDIAVSLPELSMIANLILAHHERYDGKGYPKGLKGEEIPLFARITAVVDYYDKLAYGYKDTPPIGHEQALIQIKSMSGTYFDPTLVDML